MKRIIFIIAVGLSFQLAVGAAFATQTPITLKCQTDDGIPAVDLLIDLENKEMKWGTSQYASRYKIIKISDKYITALETQSVFKEAGGEVWVMDRASGEYWRASVGMTCRGKGCTDYKMSADTYMGICRKPMF